jgi:hypothetical protein
MQHLLQGPQLLVGQAPQSAQTRGDEGDGKGVKIGVGLTIGPFEVLGLGETGDDGIPVPPEGNTEPDMNGDKNPDAPGLGVREGLPIIMPDPPGLGDKEYPGQGVLVKPHVSIEVVT